MGMKNMIILSALFSIVILSSLGSAFALDELTVTKTATPQDINLFGLGGIDTTTIEIGVDGFGEDSVVDVLFLMDGSGSVARDPT